MMRRNATHHKKSKHHVGRGKHLKRFGDGWTDNGQEYHQELLMIFKKSSQVMYEIHFKIIGNCIKRNITPEMIIKLRNLRNLRKNVRQVTKMRTDK